MAVLPPPWLIYLVLKLSIAFANATIAFGGYVYIGRLCIPTAAARLASLGDECQWPFLPFVWFRSLWPYSDNRFLNCPCRTWDDDDFGVYQGTCVTLCVCLYPKVLFDLERSGRIH